MVPMHTDPVVDQLQPGCVPQLDCVVSWVHGVSAPAHDVVPLDQLHPNRPEQALDVVSEPQAGTVPVQLLATEVVQLQGD
jgi:hypothetical protein